MNKKKLFTILACTLIISSCGNRKQNKETLTIFHAGSFAYPIKKLAEKYSESNPGIEILTEAGGSVSSARKITELGKNCDVFISSDYRVIDEILYPDYASWNLYFATNEMCIAFTEHSVFSEKVNSQNWIEIMADKNVKTGRSDPASDPCGYRTILLFKLAEKYYNAPKFPEIMSVKDKRYIRPKEVDLLALLETLSVDYIFIYRSVAVQHKLNYINLPDSVNLGNPACNDYYKQVSTKIPGKSPNDLIDISGEAIIYSLTIPKNAKNNAQAIQFVNFILETDVSKEIMENLGQKMIIPPIVSNELHLPLALKKHLNLSVHEKQ